MSARAGVRVTHYRLTLPAQDVLQLRGLPEAQRLGSVDALVDVWLDDQDLPRRLRAT
jgi:hypothetical protein